MRILPEWYYLHVLGNEGLYADHPSDRGGKTMRGILWTTYQSLGQKVYGKAPTWNHFINLTSQEATMMLDYFCKLSGADKIQNEAIRAAITEIHWGTGSAGSTVLKTARQFGFKTGDWRKFINDLGDSDRAEQFSIALIENYRARLQQLINADPSQEVFKKGWWRRLDEFQNKQKTNYWLKKK